MTAGADVLRLAAGGCNDEELALGEVTLEAAASRHPRGLGVTGLGFLAAKSPATLLCLGCPNVEAHLPPHSLINFGVSRGL